MIYTYKKIFFLKIQKYKRLDFLTQSFYLIKSNWSFILFSDLVMAASQARFLKVFDMYGENCRIYDSLVHGMHASEVMPIFRIEVLKVCEFEVMVNSVSLREWSRTVASHG